MRKDIEWAKNRIENTLKFEALNDREIGFKVAMEEALGIIDQLDKPEVLSQEWIDKNVVHIRGFGDIFKAEDVEGILVPKKEVLSQEWIDEHKYRYDNIEVVGIKDLQNLIVPKQELPVLPKYVAEYLEFAKSDVSLMRILEIASTRDELPRWEKEYDWISANDEAFARAWLDGYEVEEEQKYYVINNEKYFLLAKDKAHGFVFSTGGNSRLGGPKNISAIFELTEQEIKDYDERYWAFAKPVEEMEE